MKTWVTQIDQITQNFIKSFNGLGTEELNWKPNSDTWSIAQNIDHLIVINETYFPVIEAVKKGTYKLPFLSKIGFVVSFFGDTVLRAVQPDAKKKLKTSSIWEPSKSEINKRILDTFKNHQSELKKMIQNSNDLVMKGVVISSPANKNIVYKLEKAFEIIVAHEVRHFEHAKEVLRLLTLSSTN